MALDKNDLEQIKEIVTTVVDDRAEKTETDLHDYVDFSFEKYDQKLEVRFEKIDAKFGAIDKRFEAIDKRFDKFDQNLTDLIETNQEFLKILGDHQKRIVCVERKLDIKSA